MRDSSIKFEVLSILFYIYIENFLQRKNCLSLTFGVVEPLNTTLGGQHDAYESHFPGASRSPTFDLDDET